MTKFILDSGDPNEFREMSELFRKNNSELWGGTTNPSLIAKKLAGSKISRNDLFKKQKDLVLEILSIVPGSVSAEVYSDSNTSSDEMTQQGLDIASWHDRVTVKIPTTLEGLKTRTNLRKQGVSTNNTLVFSQEQIFAICLHEHIISKNFGPIPQQWPTFISPFVGRLDDIGINGMDLIRTGMSIKKYFTTEVWMLEASIRSVDHIKQGLLAGTELMTAPANVYRDHFQYKLPDMNTNVLSSISPWIPDDSLSKIDNIDKLIQSITTGEINIRHDLTDAGLERFANDWNSLVSN